MAHAQCNNIVSRQERVKSLLDEAIFPLYRSPILNSSRDVDREVKDFRPDPDVKNPKSFRGFIERVLTFHPQTWGADPNAALYFAKYGWRGTTDFNIHCNSCWTTMDCSYVIQKFDLWFLLAKRGHGQLCHRSFLSTPDDFFKLPTDPEVTCESIMKIWDDMITLDINLPSISKVTINDLGIDNKIVELFFQALDTDVTEIGINALVLGICGWIKGSSKDSLECNFCQRGVGLWNFYSIKDKTPCVEDLQPCSSSESMEESPTSHDNNIPSDCEVPLEGNDYVSEECSELSQLDSDDEDDAQDDDDDDDDDNVDEEEEEDFEEIERSSDVDCVEVMPKSHRSGKFKSMHNTDSEGIVVSEDEEVASTSQVNTATDPLSVDSVSFQGQMLDRNELSIDTIALMERDHKIRVAQQIRKRAIARCLNKTRRFRFLGKIPKVSEANPLKFVSGDLAPKRKCEVTVKFEDCQDTEEHISTCHDVKDEIVSNIQNLPELETKQDDIKGENTIVELYQSSDSMHIHEHSRDSKLVLHEPNIEKTNFKQRLGSPTMLSNEELSSKNGMKLDVQCDSPDKNQYLNLVELQGKKRGTEDVHSEEFNRETPLKRRKVDFDNCNEEVRYVKECTSSNMHIVTGSDSADTLSDKHLEKEIAPEQSVSSVVCPDTVKVTEPEINESSGGDKGAVCEQEGRMDVDVAEQAEASINSNSEIIDERCVAIEQSVEEAVLSQMEKSKTVSTVNKKPDDCCNHAMNCEEQPFVDKGTVDSSESSDLMGKAAPSISDTPADLRNGIDATALNNFEFELGSNSVKPCKSEGEIECGSSILETEGCGIFDCGDSSENAKNVSRDEFVINNIDLNKKICNQEENSSEVKPCDSLKIPNGNVSTTVTENTAYEELSTAELNGEREATSESMSGSCSESHLKSVLKCNHSSDYSSVNPVDTQEREFVDEQRVKVKGVCSIANVPVEVMDIEAGDPNEVPKSAVTVENEPFCKTDHITQGEKALSDEISGIVSEEGNTIKAKFEPSEDTGLENDTCPDKVGTSNTTVCDTEIEAITETTPSDKIAESMKDVVVDVSAKDETVPAEMKEESLKSSNEVVNGGAGEVQDDDTEDKIVVVGEKQEEPCTIDVAEVKGKECLLINKVADDVIKTDNAIVAPVEVEEECSLTGKVTSGEGAELENTRVVTMRNEECTLPFKIEESNVKEAAVAEDTTGVVEMESVSVKDTVEVECGNVGNQMPEIESASTEMGDLTPQLDSGTAEVDAIDKVENVMNGTGEGCSGVLQIVGGSLEDKSIVGEAEIGIYIPGNKEAESVAENRADDAMGGITIVCVTSDQTRQFDVAECATNDTESKMDVGESFETFQPEISPGIVALKESKEGIMDGSTAICQSDKSSECVASEVIAENDVENTPRKRKLSLVDDGDEIIADHKRYKLDTPIVKVDFHPINEHRFWCIHRLKTMNSGGVPKPGWEQVRDCLSMGLTLSARASEKELDLKKIKMRLAEHTAEW